MIEKIKRKWWVVIVCLLLLTLVGGAGKVISAPVQEGNGTADEMMKLHIQEQQNIEKGKKVFEGLLKQDKGKKVPSLGTEEYLKRLLEYADPAGKLRQQDPQKWELIDAYAADYYARNVLPPIGTPEEELLKQKQSPSSDVRIQAGLYNRYGARDYAYTYVFSYNSAYHPFSADCTNFISQALKDGGGISMVDMWWYPSFDPRDWYYYRKGTDSYDSNNDDIWSWSWVKVKYLYYHIILRLGKLVSSASQLQIGDVVQIDFKPADGTLDHSTIVTKIDPDGTRRVTYHTIDRKDISLKDDRLAGNQYYLQITY